MPTSLGFYSQCQPIQDVTRNASILRIVFTMPTSFRTLFAMPASPGCYLRCQPPRNANIVRMLFTMLTFSGRYSLCQLPSGCYLQCPPPQNVILNANLPRMLLLFAKPTAVGCYCQCQPPRHFIPNVSLLSMLFPMSASLEC